MGDNFSETISIDIGSPQGCVLSAILFTLYTNDLKVVSKDESGCLIIKFTDDTTLVGLIKDGDEETYRTEIKRLETRCELDSLQLNAIRTKELIVDFRKKRSGIHPIKKINRK